MNLGQYIFYRIVGVFLQLLGALALVFSLIQIMISFFGLDPTVFFLINFRGVDPQKKAAVLSQLRQQLGLDKPLIVRYFYFLRDLFLKGSLGTSWGTGLDVSKIVADALPNTMITFGFAFLIYTPLAFLLGIMASQRRGGIFDSFIRVATTATYAIPSYIVGLWVVILFSGYDLAPWPRPIPSGFLGLLRVSLLPILVVVLIYTGFQFRLVRAHMLEILQSNYIRTARAKGLTERTIVYKHALRNALPYFVTTIAVTFPIAFSGVAALEVVFQIPGIGFVMIAAANNFDWPILIGVTAVFTILNAFLLGITDIVVIYLSPKLRFEKRFSMKY